MKLLSDELRNEMDSLHQAAPFKDSRIKSVKNEIEYLKCAR